MSNRLTQSQSLYLRKHADNPIDWWPWCEEALTKAKQENKPIFLSIGYSSCHWCTVMEGEAFSDPDVADYMNAHYVAIKVDREERPDLDSIYMQALQLLTGQGGWPLNVFLSPEDLVPFYGGTYFPQQPKFNRPGFVQVLQALRRFYDVEHEKLATVKDEVLQRLQQLAGEAGRSELNQALLRRGLEYSAGVLAARGMGPNFPMIPYAAAALREARFNRPDSESASESPYDAAALCRQRGLDLALGGIYDHVGGGFHRYTVDGTWTVPHFEKMLYDNGQIVEFLADLWAMGVREPAFERAVAGTVQWLNREMTAPNGYFYAAQDADSFVTPDQAEPEEGAFYVWTYAELAQQLDPNQLAELVQQFTVTTAGNFEQANVLQRYSGESTPIEAVLAQLFALRYGSKAAHNPALPFPPARSNSEAKTQDWPARIPPVTDTKMIVAWNSLMISGLARAAAAFQQIDYLTTAERAARFILGQQRVEDRLHRVNYEGQPSVIAQSEDYALLIKALLDLHQVALAFQQEATSWLQVAIELQAEFDQFLWSNDQDGYYNTDARNDLVVRERNYGDNATPSANGIAVMNLVRLFLNTENTAYLNRAEQTLLAFSSVMQNTPQTCPTLFCGLDWFQHMTLIRTRPDQIPALAAQYLPTAQYLVEALPDGTVGLVCQGLSCQAPAGSEAELQTQLQQSLVRTV
jgi:uncharacterized protein